MSDSELTTPEAATPSRGRSIAVVVCVVLAAILTTPAVVGYWGQRTLNDSERYLATVEPLVSSAEVQDAISTAVISAIENQVDVETVINDAFAGLSDQAPRLQLLAGPLAAAIDSLIEREVREFIASDTFADLWVRINVRAQQALQRILTGDGTGAVQVQGDQVVLDVSEVIDQVKQRLVDRGLTIVEKVPIPDTDRQIVLLESQQLDQLRTIYAFGNPLARWLIVVVAGLFLVAYVLSRRRPRMAVTIGAVLAVNALLIAWVLSIGGTVFVNELSGTAFGPASRVFYNTLLAFLERGWHVMLWLGLILVVAGWFAGSNRYGTAVRSSLAGGLEGIGQSVGDGQIRSAGVWVAANVHWLRIATAVLGFVIVLWGFNVSPERLFWSTVTVVVLLAILQVLVGASRGKPDDLVTPQAVAAS